MGHIVWSEAAAGIMERLNPALRHAIQRRTEYLQRTPRMYALAQDSRLPGLPQLLGGRGLPRLLHGRRGR